MIKGKVPGSGKMYEFADMNHSVDEMKNLIRKRTKDSMADEANKAFELSTAIFEELNNFTY
jgi:heme oxygenase